jgi:hypothetical protein
MPSLTPDMLKTMPLSCLIDFLDSIDPALALEPTDNRTHRL